jgi:hypothetical protein
LTEREITRWICLYVGVSIFQLAALYDAMSHSRYVWAAWFGTTWVGLVALLSDLVMLTRGEE